MKMEENAGSTAPGTATDIPHTQGDYSPPHSHHAGGAPPPPPSAGSTEGDWTCDDCENVNFARRSSCNRCHKARSLQSSAAAAAAAAKKRKLGHEIGKAAAEKSKGLFSADDWQCNKCGNVNWARRQQCNVCNAPKFGEVEERTGFGGGYNDRGVVEYKEREESDDEYDEFGRRKKKKRRGSKEETSSTTRNNHKKEEEEDEEDEEEDEEVKEKDNNKEEDEEDEDEEEDEDDDDDEDGDLSKYDLSDWGEK